MAYNYKTLVKNASLSTGIPYVMSDKVFKAILREIVSAVEKNEKVSLRGFGVFEKQTRKERIIKSIGSNENQLIPCRKVLTFKASKCLKQNKE